MRKRTMAVAALGAALLACGVWFASLDRETRGIIAAMPTNADVLSWSTAQRDAAFRAMDRLPVLAKAADIAPSPTPLPLPAGKPLAIPGVDKYLAGQRAAGIVILQDGKVRFERYGLGFDANGRWTSFSVAKSFTSTLVGAALKDGLIKSMDDKVSDYLPDMKGSTYDDVSLRQLLTMTSGVQWNEDYGDPQSDVARFNNHQPEPGVDALISYMRRLPRAAPAGARWNYSTGETNLIGLVLNAAIQKPLTQYLQEKIWQPAGMEQQATWLLSKTGKEISGCCVQASVRDYARLGQFILEGAQVGGQGILPDGWLHEATHKQADIGAPGRGYGYQWWTYDSGSFAARGIFGQGIFIDPARQLVIVSNGNWNKAGSANNPSYAAREDFYQAVQKAVDDEAAAAPKQ